MILKKVIYFEIYTETFGQKILCPFRKKFPTLLLDANSKSISFYLPYYQKKQTWYQKRLFLSRKLCGGDMNGQRHFQNWTNFYAFFLLTAVSVVCTGFSIFRIPQWVKCEALRIPYLSLYVQKTKTFPNCISGNFAKFLKDVKKKIIFKITYNKRILKFSLYWNQNK